MKPILISLADGESKINTPHVIAGVLSVITPVPGLGQSAGTGTSSLPETSGQLIRFPDSRSGKDDSHHNTAAIFFWI